MTTEQYPVVEVDGVTQEQAAAAAVTAFMWIREQPGVTREADALSTARVDLIKLLETPDPDGVYEEDMVGACEEYRRSWLALHQATSAELRWIAEKRSLPWSSTDRHPRASQSFRQATSGGPANVAPPASVQTSPGPTPTLTGTAGIRG